MTPIITRVHNNSIGITKRLDAFWERRTKNKTSGNYDGVGLDFTNLKQQVFKDNNSNGKKKYNFIKVDADENNIRIVSQNNELRNMKLTDKEAEIGDLRITIKGKQEENEVKTFFPECYYKVGRNGKEIVLYFKSDKELKGTTRDESSSQGEKQSWRSANTRSGSLQNLQN